MLFKIIINFTLLIIFLIASSSIGVFLLKKMKIGIFKNMLSNYIFGFFLIEAICFISFLLGTGVFKLPFYISFLPFLSILWIIIESYIKKNKIINYCFSIKNHYPVILLMLPVLILYVFEVYNQVQAVITNEGVIYQDIIYHAGISNSIMEFGFPVKDLQYNGGYITYHIFTHFVISQFSYISSFNTNQIYVLFFPFISFLSISILILDIVKFKLRSQFSLMKYLVIGLFTFFGAFFIGNSLSTSFLTSFFLSYSYQWQLIIMLLILFIIIKKNKNSYNLQDYIVLVFLFSLAIVTKGSSLPIILVGFGFVILNKVIEQKKIIISDIIFIAVCTIVGASIYLFLFSSENGADFTSFFGFNNNLTIKTLLIVIFNKIGLSSNNSFLVVGLLISVIAYRYYLIKHISKTEAAFIIGVLFIGILFFLFYTNNPIYFLLPSLFISNLLVGIYLFQDYKELSKGQLIILFGFILLSLYPISSLGFGVKKKIENKSKTYFPMSNERVEIYDWIKNNTNKNDIIFTPSIYSTNNLISDNYYPAAMSRRSFYIGGCRFGNAQFFDDFEMRKNLADNFSFTDENIIKKLKEENIDYLLIEYLGNKTEMSNQINEALKIEKDNFKVLYHNDSGIIFKFN